MLQSSRSVAMDVDLSALRHNLAVVRALAGGREVIASIKANAYGFGAVGISRALVDAGVRKLWTGNVDEAIALRDAGIDAEILLFGGIEPQQVEAVLRHDFQPTIFDDAGAEMLAKAAAAAGRRAPVWIKLDAGLGRFGVALEQASAFVERVAARGELDLRGVYSHLPFGSKDGADWARERCQLFNAVIDALRGRGVAIPVTQIWGSSGVLADLPDACEAVCVGHALFGISPLEQDVGSHPALRPLIRSVSAPVLQVGGAGVEGGGYGARGNSLAATLGIGLADGLAKAKHGEAQVIVGERRVPIRGFTLEYLMIDVSDGAAPATFDRALIIGEAGDVRITVDDWAAWTGVSPLEVMMSLSDRMPVRYVDAPTG
ncbi:alanine racemase [Sphingopyxis panaciterrae]|uniref:alanine racemase n=1 Tax=Sphingopyxis panaciterrae TaxID=363841 RepID=UPI00142480CA|nr:alanine racemase [Sphingopyxis panaciterrae]NIJ36366.1 alanine racemase [Sphingopyxis panaciterrae]